MTRHMNGQVYLVGAGPGDPELLTLKALRVLRSADVVLHDDLVSPAILRLLPPTVLIHNVGKRCGAKAIRQDEVNTMMVKYARSGLAVVRLKGGDPLIFGRAGEEIAALRAADIGFEIVPGVTAAIGAAAVAEITLTQRHVAPAVALVTYTHADGVPANWRAILASGATVALYMPGDDYGRISRDLCDAGLDPGTACFLVSRATTPAEQVRTATVGGLAGVPPLPSPTLMVIGAVARGAVDRAPIARQPANLFAHQQFS